MRKANQILRLPPNKVMRKILFNGKFLKALSFVSPFLNMKFRYLVIHGSLPNLDYPRTFDEKLIWLNFFWQDPLKSQCGNKYTMRDYVEKHGLDHILTPLLGVYNSAYEIDFEQLPNKFVLKCTHGCHYNVICHNKTYLDIARTEKQLNRWLEDDYSQYSGELHYASMIPRIICEEFLEDPSSVLPIDYKVYCFSGQAHCTMACLGRSGHRLPMFLFYDRNWKKLPYSRQSILGQTDIHKPNAYEEIIECAEQLSKPFPFVRLDFYSIKGRAILGEMTFTPSGCVDPGLTAVAQKKMGDLIILPRRLVKT